MSGKNFPESGDAYYLTGKFKALDAAGEWFRDDDGTLYLWTPDGDSPAGHTVEAKRREYAFDLRDRQYVNVEGFDIFAADVTTNRGRPPASQRPVGVVRLALHAEDPGWDQPHDTGIYLDGEDNSITDSVVAYSGGHGIVLSATNNRAENNVVRDVAYNAGDSAGIRTAGSGHVVTKNTVYNTGRSGIKFSNSTSLQDHQQRDPRRDAADHRRRRHLHLRHGRPRDGDRLEQDLQRQGRRVRRVGDLPRQQLEQLRRPPQRRLEHQPRDQAELQQPRAPDLQQHAGRDRLQRRRQRQQQHDRHGRSRTTSSPAR